MEFPSVKHLYIYKPPNDKTEEIFVEKKLWASKPAAFNDPFDCNLEIEEGFTEAGVLRAIHNRFGARKDWPPNITALIEQHLDVRGKFTPLWRTHVESVQQQIIDYNGNLGVVCMSQVNDSILMWSHYAAKHTGVCIEFERKPCNHLGDPDVCMPVKYTRSYPGIKLMGPNGPTLSPMLRSKAKCWAYEKEWRLFTTNGDAPCDLPGNISKVIFGLRTPSEFKTRIQAHCDSHGIPTLEASRVPRNFKIVVPAGNSRRQRESAN